MRRSYFLLLAMAAPLSMAGAANAFDPDTPVASASDDSFPLKLKYDVDPTIHAAFFAAFEEDYHPGARPEMTLEIEGRVYLFTPAAIHVLDDGRAILLSLGAMTEAGHADSGINAIHYLRASPSGWVREGEWFGIGAVGSMGNAATSWAFTDHLGKNPYLVSAGGGVWQGCMVNSAIVTELAASGPVDRGNFTDAMSSGAGIGQLDAQYEGRIVAAKPDHSFIVAYKGTKKMQQNYVLRNGKYQLVGRDLIPGC